jgi:hypothetical protein
MKAQIIGLCAAIVGLSLIFTPLGGALTSLLPGAPPNGVVPGPAEPGVQLPELTAVEKASLPEILASDDRLSDILGGRKFEIAEAGVWHTRLNPRKLGASLLLELPEQTDFSMRAWPVLEYDYEEENFPPYTRHVEIFGATKVQKLLVRVDLSRGEVVSIQPGPGATIVPSEQLRNRARPPEHPD